MLLPTVVIVEDQPEVVAETFSEMMRLIGLDTLTVLVSLDHP